MIQYNRNSLLGKERQFGEQMSLISWRSMSTESPPCFFLVLSLIITIQGASFSSTGSSQGLSSGAGDHRETEEGQLSRVSMATELVLSKKIKQFKKTHTQHTHIHKLRTQSWYPQATWLNWNQLQVLFLGERQICEKGDPRCRGKAVRRYAEKKLTSYPGFLRSPMPLSSAVYSTPGTLSDLFIYIALSVYLAITQSGEPGSLPQGAYKRGLQGNLREATEEGKGDELG